MRYRRAFLIGLCITAFFYETLGKSWSSGRGRSNKSTTEKGVVSTKSNTKQSISPNAAVTKVGKSSPRFILSAWGIISLITLVIISSFIIYYFTIFYPLICAKRGKYDIMEMTSV